jgi:hypothetical protein
MMAVYTFIGGLLYGAVLGFMLCSLIRRETYVAVTQLPVERRFEWGDKANIQGKVKDA